MAENTQLEETAKKKHPNPVGRPPLALNEDDIIKLARLHCTDDEIAATLGCNVDTVKDNFSDCIKKGREQGKASLRRQQMRMVMEQNSAPLAIWLGKIYLGQKEEIFHQEVNLNVTINKIEK